MSVLLNDTLTNELILATMAKAIRRLDDSALSNACIRLVAYRRAQVATEHIRDFDAIAVRHEISRRGIAPAPKKRTA